MIYNAKLDDWLHHGLADALLQSICFFFSATGVITNVCLSLQQWEKTHIRTITYRTWSAKCCCVCVCCCCCCCWLLRMNPAGFVFFFFFSEGKVKRCNLAMSQVSQVSYVQPCQAADFATHGNRSSCSKVTETPGTEELMGSRLGLCVLPQAKNHELKKG